MPNIVVLAKP